MHRSHACLRCTDTSCGSSKPDLPPSPGPPKPENEPQNAAATGQSLLLAGANIDSTEHEWHLKGQEKSMEAQDVAKDVAAEPRNALSLPIEVVEAVSLPDGVRVDNHGGQRDITTIDAISLEAVPIGGSPVADLDRRSKALQNSWHRLDDMVQSFTGALISAGDLRRGVVRKRESALEGAADALAASGDPIVQKLRERLFEVQQLEVQLQEEDEKLIEQGFNIVTQASEIFGSAADSSFRILDEQGVAVQCRDTEPEESIVDADDIRLDPTSEAKQYLSKKGEVDLLREVLMDLNEERVMASEAIEAPEVIEGLESKQKKVLHELRVAEDELLVLHDRLPDRKVNISEEHLLPVPEEQQVISAQADTVDVEEQSMDKESKSHSLPDPQGESSLSQILEDPSLERPNRPSTFVNAYLLYQYQQSPQDFHAAGAEARRISGQTIESDPRHPALDHWFEEEKQSKQSRTKNISSHGFSNRTNADTTAHVQLSHGQSEPQQTRRTLGEDSRPRSFGNDIQPRS